MSITVDRPVPLTYSLAECAALLKVSRRTLSNAVRDGQIPAIRIGGRVLVVKASFITTHIRCISMRRVRHE